MDGINWDDAFSNASYISGAESYPPRWAEAAQALRAGARLRPDLAYDTHPRAQFDLFLPEGVPEGLVVFVHGGYWMKFDKSIWSHLAAGAVARGWAVAIPSYTLAPEARLSAMTAQIAQGVTTAAALVAGPIALAGHSAGGHLVTRMICAGTALPADVLTRVGHVMSISGLHDLRPLLATQMNRTLGLTPQEAAIESPALLAPVRGIPVTVWVGALERPEFLRQASLLREAWTRAGTPVALEVEGGRHHFDVIDGLAHGESAITLALLQDAPRADA